MAPDCKHPGQVRYRSIRRVAVSKAEPERPDDLFQPARFPACVAAPEGLSGKDRITLDAERRDARRHESEFTRGKALRRNGLVLLILEAKNFIFLSL
jgi:hypothetical protein